MTLVARIAHRPQRLWLRQAMFQIHLWTGLILGLYIVVIGLSGSVLVFRQEIEQLLYPHLFVAHSHPGKLASLSAVAASVRAAFPRSQLSSIYLPRDSSGTYTVFLQEGHYVYAYADPESARVLGRIDPSRSLLYQLVDLHDNLLSGQKGRFWNGVGAGILLLLTGSGIAIWWPGVKRSKQALRINVRRSWRRINFDLHSAVGFWSLTILVVWALTGLYFAWPRQTTTAVAKLFPLTPVKQLNFGKLGTSVHPDLDGMAAEALRREPAMSLRGVALPFAAGQPLIVVLAAGDLHRYGASAAMYFDPASGRYSGASYRGKNRTFGDTLLWYIYPLHFGVYWGLAVKVVWSLLGLTLPLLFITGALMYWNRVFAKHWRRSAKRASGRVSEAAAPV